MTVTPEAVTAAALRLKEGHARLGVRLPANDRRALAADILEAAAPHLAAAERERLIALAEKHAPGYVLTYNDAGLPTGFETFADLIRKEALDAETSRP